MAAPFFLGRREEVGVRRGLGLKIHGKEFFIDCLKYNLFDNKIRLLKIWLSNPK